MAGLTDEQWTEVVQRLAIIDTIPGEIKEVNEKIEDTKLSVNRIQVEITKIDTSLFGVGQNNGIRSEVRKNTAAIERLENRIPKKKDLKGIISIVVSILLFIYITYDRVENSIIRNINQQSTAIQANPTP